MMESFSPTKKQGYDKKGPKPIHAALRNTRVSFLHGISEQYLLRLQNDSAEIVLSPVVFFANRRYLEIAEVEFLRCSSGGVFIHSEK